jgi:hypothetical protein
MRIRVVQSVGRLPLGLCSTLMQNSDFSGPTNHLT